MESPGDLETEGFLYVRTFTESEFADRIGRIGGPQPAADGIAEKIQIIERDSAGYVKRAQIGNMDYTGDEVRIPWDFRHHALFFLRGRKDPGILERIGSGYGFSQAGADAMERQRECVSGTAEILFPGIEIVKIAE